MTRPEHPFDTVTVEELRAGGSVKWTSHGDALGAFIAEMDFGTAPAVRDALREAVERAAFGYLPRRLSDDLALACAAWHAERYGWNPAAEWIHPLPDVLKGLEVALDLRSPPGRPLILPTPAYMPFLTAPALLGRDLIQVPMARAGDAYELDLDALGAAFRAGGDLLVLCNPWNPVGRVFTESELAAVADVVERHGGHVFADEIHAPLTYPGHRHVPYASVSDAAARHAVTATSASKAWNLPGLKCAQLILTNPGDAARFAETGSLATHGASTLGVIAGIAAYTAGRAWLDDVLGYLDGNRRLLATLLAEHLPGVGYTMPEGTYLAWLDFTGLGLGDHPGAVLHERAGVVLVDGPECGEPGRGHARLNFATPRPVLERLVTGLAGAVSTAGSRP
ncbi:MalY/PatB family protein [Prauserella muralis]|uniref:cysteine-S-conjugate beta-lyase n=1 Tax=Prauserella muralis TaxID=588067 RepID=A0A2V4AP77_9PSEU|nr:aminotransferase class I/II-fold pyridoxal phosphate-dependent enzyme [Prauserella muralis]PXY22258.1 aminotransferase class I/II [Prauserella muralis]TWE27896.1 cystathionine beta-lyase [Prauserella muralis]